MGILLLDDMGRPPKRNHRTIPTADWIKEQDKFHSKTQYPYCKGTFPDCPTEIKQDEVDRDCKLCPIYKKKKEKMNLTSNGKLYANKSLVKTPSRLTPKIGKLGKKKESHLKYFKNIVYKGDYTEIFVKKMNASPKALIKLLEESPLTRKELTEKTGWTRGQIAGLLHRGIRDGILELNSGIISLIKEDVKNEKT